ncbi:BMP family ABC transporter substrate-binding protein [Helcococcus sueciensis]|uniref:BMP family ABC transporter substrate-binding protein n=1 Tax=Helcococcus sueciensis TaxID=241555 RepID=UPI0004298400|nr:BMP family ABC transporter substrate-binding protein [Helcococcus sueciensis]
MSKRILSLLLALVLVFSLVACSTKPNETKEENNTETLVESNKETQGESEETTKEPEESADLTGKTVGMVTDTGGINDESFNQTSWAGLNELEAKTGAKASYVQSEQEADYNANLNQLVDANTDLVWGIGYLLAGSVETVSKQAPDTNFAVIDNAYENPESLPNVTGVVFKAEQPSFLVGYIAGHTTKTNKVGFVGGMKGVVIDQFEYGYRAGVLEAAKELGKEITVDIQYADSFNDEAKGKSIATRMFNDGSDIVFHAAGGVGKGVIEAAKELNKFAIGVDADQSGLAPKNVLTSALKKVDVAIYDLSKRLLSGEKLGGQTVVYTANEEAVGIPEYNAETALYPEELHKKALDKLEEIKADKIVPPFNEEEWNKYIAE